MSFRFRIVCLLIKYNGKRPEDNLHVCQRHDDQSDVLHAYGIYGFEATKRLILDVTDKMLTQIEEYRIGYSIHKTIIGGYGYA